MNLNHIRLYTTYSYKERYCTLFPVKIFFTNWPIWYYNLFFSVIMPFCLVSFLFCGIGLCFSLSLSTTSGSILGAVEVVATEAIENFVFSSDRFLKSDLNYCPSCVFFVFLTFSEKKKKKKKSFSRIIFLRKKSFSVDIFFIVCETHSAYFFKKRTFSLWLSQHYYFHRWKNRILGRLSWQNFLPPQDRKS